VGLIKELVLLPVAPLRFTVWVAEQVADEADRQQYSVGAGVQQLDEIEQARDKGELHEEEAEELEGKVIEQQVGGAPTTEPEEDAQRG
jgi:RPA family protein